MEKRFEEILRIALFHKATDIHISVFSDNAEIKVRGINGLVQIKSEPEDIQLFNYLQYQARLDITCLNKPQSGSFSYFFDGHFMDFRFAVLVTRNMKNGVLRVLNCQYEKSLDSLTYDKESIERFREWLNLRSGLILFTGLTGSGKTTTLYTLLNEATGKTIYSLEDPIEIAQSNIMQLEINEKIGFGYDEGIKQILRHNPDIIMIGEIRDEKAAKMTVRAALTGCLVLTSLHAKSTTSAITRLLELGVQKNDLFDSLIGIVNQRLLKRKNCNDFTCVYDILDGYELEEYMNNPNYRDNSMDLKIADAVEKGILETNVQFQ